MKPDIRQITLGALATNGYLVGNPETKEAVFIDPAAECGRIMREVTNRGYRLAAILLTHGHFDHTGAVTELKEKTGAKIYAGEQERAVLESADLNCSGWYQRFAVQGEIWLSEHQVITPAGLTFQVLTTPGHTAGSVCYYMEKEGILFSGDTLFEGSIGRSDLPTGNMSVLLRSLGKLTELPEAVVVYPGHGPSTTIGDEKKQNPYL